MAKNTGFPKVSKAEVMGTARMGIRADGGIITGTGGCVQPTYFWDCPPTSLARAEAMAEPHNEVMRCN